MYPILLSKKAIKGVKLLRKENPKYAAKLWDLILDIFINPFDGLGEPEALKNNLVLPHF
jgi:Txe/YoeB family toxin of Txe-Axe toxin-antitoxin module